MGKRFREFKKGQLKKTRVIYPLLSLASHIHIGELPFRWWVSFILINCEEQNLRFPKQQ